MNHELRSGLRLLTRHPGFSLTAIVTLALGNLLYGVAPLDPLTFAAVSVVLIGVAIMASVFPARRAALDPIATLRR